MKGVKFNNYHSFNEFSLILTGKTLETPKAKTYLLKIDGADGVLDLTEYFEKINYENRKLTCTFETKLRGQEYYDMFDSLINKLHGRKMEIRIDEEPNFYLEGRISINEYKSNEKIGRVVIDADCFPFKLEDIETIVEYEVKGFEQEIVLTNLTRKVEVEIEVLTDTNISVENSSTRYTYNNGLYKLEFLLEEGNNLLKINGVGTIRFKFRRGKL